jgi:septum formation inhibitor MinC
MSLRMKDTKKKRGGADMRTEEDKKKRSARMKKTEKEEGEKEKARKEGKNKGKGKTSLEMKTYFVHMTVRSSVSEDFRT